MSGSKMRAGTVALVIGSFLLPGVGCAPGPTSRRRLPKACVTFLLVFGFALGTFGVLQLTASQAEAAPSTWSINPSPNNSSGDYLSSVSCSNKTFCEAVGYYDYRNDGVGEAQTLIETWNGTSWSIVLDVLRCGRLRHEPR